MQDATACGLLNLEIFFLEINNLKAIVLLILVTQTFFPNVTTGGIFLHKINCLKSILFLPKRINATFDWKFCQK